MHDARDRNAGVWIEHSDRLYVAAYSSVASLVITFSGYFRKMNGEIIEYAITVNPTSDRAVTEGNQHFGAGFLLSCVARLTSGNANRGQCYVRARVQRSTGSPLLALQDIVGGYVSDDFTPSFPYGKIEGPLEGQGMIRSITGTDPAAGAEISESVPAGARWILRGFVATLVTSGDVATRYVRWTLDDGTTIFNKSESGGTQTATLTRLYIANDMNFSTGTAPDIYVPWFIGGILMAAGYRLKTVTDNFQAADNWGAPQLSAEEWIEA